ncbi:MAG: leucine-rich repeat protein [Lachnospiraceae bacterium]|nr:leucine-rich repeat protein [Lachnospiraceae bacterium]
MDKNNHAGETEVKNAKKATCTADGYTGDTYCKDCGAKIATGTKVAALGAPKKGVVAKSDKATYKVTESDLKNGTVAYVGPLDKKATKVTIPATVEIDGVTFKVTSIEKNAFKNNKKVKTVTIGKNVSKIGAKAFYGCSKLKTLKIKTTKLTAKKIGSKAFSKTSKSMKVTVPKKKFKTYKTMLIKKGVNKKAKFKKG